MPIKIEWSVTTDRGQVRKKNEDYYLAWKAPDLPSSILGIFAVADGMGGHPGGDVASHMVIEGLRSILPGCEIDSYDTLRECVVSSFQQTHTILRERMDEEPELRGMGTTMTALIVTPDHLFAGHVGDSRLYEIDPPDQPGRVVCLTRDHTLAREQVDAGILACDDLEKHPLSHVLTRSLGAGEMPQVDQLDLGTSELTGRVFLVCSDGLIRVIEQNEISDIIAGKNLDKATQALVDIANERGAPDNVTVVLVRVQTVS